MSNIDEAGEGPRGIWDGTQPDDSMGRWSDQKGPEISGQGDSQAPSGKPAASSGPSVIRVTATLSILVGKLGELTQALQGYALDSELEITTDIRDGSGS